MVAIRYPAFSLGLSNLGNTLGDTGVTGTRIVLAGVGNITLSEVTNLDGGTISISGGGGGGGGGSFSAGISGGNTAGVTGLTGSSLALAGGNNITLSGAADLAGGSITILAPNTSVLSAVAPLSTATAGSTISILGPPSFSAGVSSVGNTAGDTGLTGSQLVLAGGTNITLSQSTNASGATVTISGGAGGGTQTAISGLGNSETTYTSGTVNLSGLGAITVRSTTGQAFQFSVAPQSVQPETQTFIGGVVASNTTYTSGTVNIVGSGIVTVQSGTGQRVIVNATQSVQTQNAVDVTLAGNTSGVLALVSSGTLTLAGGNNITLSQAGNAVTISGPAAAGAQTAISGIAASNTTYTSGTVTITGVGGGITVNSNTGQRIDLSVAAPVAQTGTQFTGGLSGGNTSGDTGTVAGRLLLAGGNNVTLSGSTNGASMSITISGANIGGAQTGISGIANSQTTYTSGTVSLSELGAITIRSTTGNQFQLSVAAQTVESQSFGMSNIGNTSGTTGIASGGQVRFLLAGGNNVTLSQSLNGASGTITVSAASQSAESQSIGMSNIGNTSGTTGIASGAQVRMLFAGGNNITLSQSLNGASGTITISAPNAQTAVSGIANSQTTYTSGTVSLSELGAITIRSTTGNQFQFSVNSQTVQTQNLHNVTISGNTSGALAAISSGTMTLAGGNNITLSQAGNAITISGANAAGAQTAISGLANSQTTYTSGTVSLSELGAITIRSTTGNQFQFSVNSQSVQTQSLFSAGVSTGGNTAGATGVSGTRMVLVAEGVLSLSQTTAAAGNTVSIQAPATSVLSAVAPLSTSTNGSTISILGPPSFSAGVSTMGNTLGNTGLTGSQLVFAGINNITLSQSSNASGATLSISGPSVAGAQTGISGIANSQTTYTSGTVSLSELGAITIRSTTGNQFQLSVNSQTAESQSIGMSNIGNTSGTTGIASGAQVRMLFAGGNNITLSQSLNGASGTITISAPNAQTGVSGIANSQTTYTSGTVSLSELGAITIRSTTGNQFQFSVNAQTGTQFSAGISGGNTSGDTGTVGGRVVFAGGNNITLSGSTNGVSETITISAFTQTVQTQNLHNVTLSGNTAGALAAISSGTMTLAGGNNITLSQAGNAVTISGGAGGGFSAGMSNIGNTSGDTGITGSRLVLAGGNNITLSQSTNVSGGTVTVSAPNAQTGISGIANSQTTYTSGTVSMSELGAITIRSTTGNQYQFSVAAQTVESQSIGMSNIGNTSGTTGIASGGQVRFLFAGGNNITLSQSLNGASGTITVSAPNAQTGISGIAASNTTYTSGTITITGVGGGVTVSSNTGQRIDISVAAQSAQTGISGIANSQTTYTSGTVSLSELGAITIRSTTGNQYQFSVNAQTGTQFSMGLSNLGNTSGDTVTVAGRVVLAGSNGITLSGSSNGVSQTITISGITQSVESQSIGASNLGNTLGTSGVASGGQVRAVIIGTSNITVSQSVNGASATLSLIGQPSFSAGLSTGGNTQGNTGISGTRLVLVATNNITMSQATDASGATISISGQSPTGGQFSGGVSNLGNTAGSTGISGSRIVFVGTNAISLSQSTDANGATISFNDTVSAFQAGVSTGGNTTGDTGMTGTRMVFVGSSPISLSQATGANGGTISINAPATSSLSAVSGIKISTNGSTISIGYGLPLADWENMPRAQASLISHISGFSKTPIYWNDTLAGDLTVKSLAFAISMVTASQPLSLSAHLGIYTLVNSTSANLLGSVSEAYVVSSASSVSLSGVRNLIMTGIGTHTALSNLTGGDYMIGMMFSATATNAMNASLLGASGGAGAFGGIYPGTNQLTTGTSQGIQALAGRGSTTVNGMPAAVSQADLVNQGQGASMPLHPWIYIRS